MNLSNHFLNLLTLCLQNILGKKLQKFIACLIKDYFMSFQFPPTSFPKGFLVLVLQDVLTVCHLVYTSLSCPHTHLNHIPLNFLFPVWRVSAFLVSPCKMIALLHQTFQISSLGIFHLHYFILHVQRLELCPTLKMQTHQFYTGAKCQSCSQYHSFWCPQLHCLFIGFSTLSQEFHGITGNDFKIPFMKVITYSSESSTVQPG